MASKQTINPALITGKFNKQRGTFADTLSLQDCMSITKAFEKAAAHSVTEESTFALMNPILSGIRAQSSSLISSLDSEMERYEVKQDIDNNDKAESAAVVANVPGLAGLEAGQSNSLESGDISPPQSSIQQAGLFNAVKNSTGENIKGSTINVIDKVMDVTCIPCKDRIHILAELNAKQMFLGIGGELAQSRNDWMTRQFSQLREMMKFFSSGSEFFDICKLREFFMDFVCPGDFAKILSALMALMMKLAFEITSVFDLILGLVGPLILPILTNMINLLEEYMLLIIKPIECIIESIQKMTSKFDYGTLFSSVDKFKVGLGPNTGLNENSRAVEFSLLGPLDNLIQEENRNEQETVNRAAEKLRHINTLTKNVDGSNPDEVTKHNKQQDAARREYREAVQEQSGTKIQSLNKTIGGVLISIKGIMATLIEFLREIATSIQAFLTDFFDEVKKLMGSYIGGSGNMIKLNFKKLIIVQLIGFIMAFKKQLDSGIKCDEKEGMNNILDDINDNNSLTFSMNEVGEITITENQEDVNDAIMEVVKALGGSQDLVSMVEFTGDPLLDVEIMRTIEEVVTPVKVSFGCTAVTSVEKVEQVNEWITSLNNE